LKGKVTIIEGQGINYNMKVKVTIIAGKGKTKFTVDIISMVSRLEVNRFSTCDFTV
jgi:hypothetical protein